MGGSCSYEWAKDALEDFGVEIDKFAPFKLKGNANTEDYIKLLYVVAPVAAVILVDEDLTVT